MKRLLAGLLFFAAVSWLIYWLISRLTAFLQSLKSDLAIAIVTAGVAGLISVVSLAISKAYETRTVINQDLRAKKIPVYEGIIRMVFQMMFAEKLGQQPLSSEDIVKGFVETTEKLTIWGSDDLILAFDKFKNGFSPSDPTSAIFGFEDLVLAIRRDLGHSGRKLGRGAILRLFVTDIEQHLGKR